MSGADESIEMIQYSTALRVEYKGLVHLFRLHCFGGQASSRTDSHDAHAPSEHQVTATLQQTTWSYLKPRVMVRIGN